MKSKLSLARIFSAILLLGSLIPLNTQTGVVRALETTTAYQQEQIVPLEEAEIKVVLDDEVLNEYQTLGLFAYQDFFDNLQSKVLSPLLSAMNKLRLPPIMPLEPVNVADIVDLSFNLTSISFNNCSLNAEPSLLQIGSNQAIFSVSNLSLGIEMDYAYVTDPPILADIGTGYLTLANVIFSSVIQFEFDNTSETLSVKMSDLHLDFDTAHLEGYDTSLSIFDGVSDFAVTAENWINLIGAVVKNRLSSMINQGLFTEKLNKLANKLIRLVGNKIDQIHLTENLFLEGFLWGNINFSHSYVYVPLKTNLYLDGAEYPYQCPTKMQDYPIYIAEKYNLEAFINNCIFNQFLWTLTESGAKVTIANKHLDTSLLAKLVGFGLTSKFGKNMPCEITAFPTDGVAPRISLISWDGAQSKTEYAWFLDSQLSLDIKCQNDETPGDETYYQATTLVVDVTANFTFALGYGPNVKLGLNSLNVKFVEDRDSEFNVSKVQIKTELPIVVGIIEGLIQSFFDSGHSFPDLFKNTPLCFLDISRIYLAPQYLQNFYIMSFGPEINFDRCSGLMQPEDNTLEFLLEQLLNFETNEFLAQIGDNFWVDFCESMPNLKQFVCGDLSNSLSVFSQFIEQERSTLKDEL